MSIIMQAVQEQSAIPAVAPVKRRGRPAGSKNKTAVKAAPAKVEAAPPVKPMYLTKVSEEHHWFLNAVAKSSGLTQVEVLTAIIDNFISNVVKK